MPDTLTLDGNEGKYWNITKVDASEYKYEAILIGNNKDNVLTAGQGFSTLWGGTGNDTLVGSTSNKVAFYYFEDGNDVIENAKKGDVIYIVGNLEDIDSASFEDCSTSGIHLRMNNGGSLDVTGTDLDQVSIMVNGNELRVNSSGYGMRQVK